VVKNSIGRVRTRKDCTRTQLASSSAMSPHSMHAEHEPHHVRTPIDDVYIVHSKDPCWMFHESMKCACGYMQLYRGPRTERRRWRWRWRRMRRRRSKRALLLVPPTRPPPPALPPTRARTCTDRGVTLALTHPLQAVAAPGWHDARLRVLALHDFSGSRARPRAATHEHARTVTERVEEWRAGGEMGEEGGIVGGTGGSRTRFSLFWSQHHPCRLF